jgi:hypothetical protein
MCKFGYVAFRHGGENVAALVGGENLVHFDGFVFEGLIVLEDAVSLISSAGRGWDKGRLCKLICLARR